VDEDKPLGYGKSYTTQYPLFELEDVVALSRVICKLDALASLKMTGNFTVLRAVWKSLRPEIVALQEQQMEEQIVKFTSIAPGHVQQAYPISLRLRAWLDSSTGLKRAAKEYFRIPD
jgi:hypothetical protein